MVFRHRRSDDERARTLDMRGIVWPNDDAESAQIIHTAWICVAPRNRHAATHEQLGKGAHARAGDAHEVDGSWVGGIEERHVRRGI
jgi:hypothetical protein